MLLAINTSTLQFSIAILDCHGVVVGEYIVNPQSRHYGNMFPSLEFMFKSVNCSMKDLLCVGVAIGPGSFTGLRVGISTALGFSHALDLPIIGINSLEGLASQLPYSKVPITSIIDSRREEVFLAQFKWNEKTGLVRTSKDLCLNYKEIPKVVKGPTIFVGNNFLQQAEHLKGTLWPEATLAPPILWNLKASTIGLLALKRYDQKQYDDPLSISPIYLRPPDIRPNPYFQGPVRGKN